MSKPRKRYVRKFGKAGQFDAFDGQPVGERFLECFVDKKAYDKAVEALKQYRIANFVSIPSSSDPDSTPMYCFIGTHVADGILKELGEL